MFASRTTRAIGFPYRDCGRRVFASSKSAGQNRQSGAPSGLKDGTATSSLSQAMRMSSRIIAFCLAFHITATYVISYNDCYGISMLPTFNSSGDCVLTSKWYRRGRGIQVGDIVSYEHPIRPGERAIKRVIGLEGDFVLRDTPGVGDGVMIQVPKGHCWIASDNLKYGYDSRHFGPLPLALIKGKIIQRFSPWYRPVDMGSAFISSALDDSGT